MLNTTIDLACQAAIVLVRDSGKGGDLVMRVSEDRCRDAP